VNVRDVRGFCRDCGVERRFRFSGIAARLGDDRPPAVHRTCSTCGLVVLTLADAHDAIGLARTVAARYVSRLDRPSAPTHKIEPDDAISHAYEQILRLYRSWRPDRLTFTSYATTWLPRRLDDWLGAATGDATRGGRRRSVPKGANDAYLDGFGDGDEIHPALGVVDDAARVRAAAGTRLERDRLVAALGGRESDYADDRLGDLRELLGGADRERVRRLPEDRLRPAGRSAA
jgi:hypothetical protein